MVSNCVMVLSVDPHYDVSLYYGVSLCYDANVLMFQLLTRIVKLAVNPYYDVACVMVSARVMVSSVNPQSCKM